MIDILKNKYMQYGLFTTSLVIVVIAYIWNVSRLPTMLELYVFDTKGNPSYFIRTPQDERILIDGGGNSEIIRSLTKIIPFYSRRIDKIIITSDNADNITGLIDVVDRYKVGRIILPMITAKESGFSSSTDKIYETFLYAINQLNVPIERIVRGDVLDFSKDKPDIASKSSDVLKAEILFPEALDKFKYSKASPPELVLKLDYGYTSFLLIGDTSLKVQKYIASSSLVGSDVLIIPHSASANSLSINIINAVKPEFIIYSQTVSNSKATPHPENSKSSSNEVDPLYMIMSDHRFNIKQKSTIEVLSDGKSVKVI